jgi:hypothetical protein
MNRSLRKAQKAASSRWNNFVKKTEKPESGQNDTWATDQYFILNFHSPQFSSADLILNKEIFKGISDNEILEIIPKDAPTFVAMVTENSFSSARGNMTISISTQLANILGLAPGKEVRIQRADSEKYVIHDVVFTVKDQYISGRDRLKIAESYKNNAIYKSQRLIINNLKLEVREMYMNNQPICTGIFKYSTKVTYRSKSARITWLFEMSRDMWKTAHDGQVYYEKALSFISTAFERLLMKKASHEIRIVFFTRVLFPTLMSEEGQSRGYSIDNQSKVYLDVYKSVITVKAIKNNWRNIIKILKREIYFFPAYVNWRINLTKAAKACLALCPIGKYANSEGILYDTFQSYDYFLPEVCIPLSDCPTEVIESIDVNFLESICITLNRFEHSMTDRKLTNTGQSIAVISAGLGVYHTTDRLAKITKYKILFKGITMNLICLRRKPSHPAPILMYEWSLVTPKLSGSIFINIEEDECTKVMSYPYWIKLHYFASFLQLEGNANIQSANHMINIESNCHPLTDLESFTNIEARKEPIIYGAGRIGADAISIMTFCNSFDIKQTSYESDEEYKEAIVARGNKFRKIASPKTKVFGGIMGSCENFYKRKISEGSDHRTYSKDESFDSSLLKSSILDTHTYSLESYHKLENLNLKAYVRKVRYSSWRRRWANCYVNLDCVLLAKNSEESYLKSVEEVWNIILEPPLLPLSTDYMPRFDELKDYQLHQSYVSINRSRRDLINELISQRLIDDFQLVTRDAIDRFGKKVQVSNLILSKGDHYHIITPSANDDYNIEFLIYPGKVPPCPYEIQAALFDILLGTFSLNTFKINSPALNSWDKLDSLILGHTPRHEFIPSVPFFTSNFILIPKDYRGSDFETEEDERVQIENIVEFRRSLQESISRANKQSLDIQILPMKKSTPDIKNLNRTNTFVLYLDSPEEWLTVEHDICIRTNTAFSIVIRWVCGSMPYIVEFINMMRRKAENCKLSFVQVQEWETRNLKNPFFPPCEVPIKNPGLIRQIFQSSMFCMMDMGKDLLIHVSGSVIVKITQTHANLHMNHFVNTTESHKLMTRLYNTIQIVSILEDIEVKALTLAIFKRFIGNFLKSR